MNMNELHADPNEDDLEVEELLRREQEVRMRDIYIHKREPLPLRFKTQADAMKYQETGDLSLAVPSHVRSEGGFMVPNYDYQVAPFERILIVSKEGAEFGTR